jgi:hypothetical protein
VRAKRRRGQERDDARSQPQAAGDAVKIFHCFCVAPIVPNGVQVKIFGQRSSRKTCTRLRMPALAPERLLTGPED